MSVNDMTVRLTIFYAIRYYTIERFYSSVLMNDRICTCFPFPILNISNAADSVSYNADVIRYSAVTPVMFRADGMT